MSTTIAQFGGPEMVNCYRCVHRREIPRDAHSSCANVTARVEGHFYGIRKGWFCWPLNFDPVWLLSCDGFAPQVSPAGSGETPT